MTSVTLLKARRIVRDHGSIELIRRAFREFAGLILAYRELGRSRTFERSDELVRFATTVGGGVVAPFQIESEVASLLDRVKAQQPSVVLEIGTADGGTLLLFSRSAHPQATIVSIDLGDHSEGHGFPSWRIPVYKRFASSGQTMHLLRADSHDPVTRARVEELLNGWEVDFLFIDGDHSNAGVRADFELFHDLVRPGGLIGFHDIVEHDAATGCEVHLLWNEVRTRYRHEEFVADPKNQRWYGIGLLHVE